MHGENNMTNEVKQIIETESERAFEGLEYVASHSYATEREQALSMMKYRRAFLAVLSVMYELEHITREEYKKLRNDFLKVYNTLVKNRVKC